MMLMVLYSYALYVYFLMDVLWSRYEKGEMCEPHSSKESNCEYSSKNPMGYKVLLYLNGGQVGDDVDSSGGPSIVDGGETVLYSQQYLIGNSKQKQIVKVCLGNFDIFRRVNLPPPNPTPN